MFGNIDEKTIKFILVLLFVVILFSIPFAVLSSKNNTARMINSQPTLDRVREESSIEEEEAMPEEEMIEEGDVNSEIEEENIEEQPSVEKENADRDTIKPLEPLENIPEEAAEANNDSVENQKSAEDLILNAEQYRNDKDYANAISAYKAAAEKAEDTEVKAMCYENTAMVYAIVKKYGSAMSYAQKAYNLSPSTNRELLLARLYYKTGDVDKATKRVNNILQRDFSIDK